MTIEEINERRSLLAEIARLKDALRDIQRQAAAADEPVSWRIARDTLYPRDGRPLVSPVGVTGQTP